LFITPSFYNKSHASFVIQTFEKYVYEYLFCNAKFLKCVFVKQCYKIRHGRAESRCIRGRFYLRIEV
jgi:hypothetical protein